MEKQIVFIEVVTARVNDKITMRYTRVIPRSEIKTSILERYDFGVYQGIDDGYNNNVPTFLGLTFNSEFNLALEYETVYRELFACPLEHESTFYAFYSAWDVVESGVSFDEFAMQSGHFNRVVNEGLNELFTDEFVLVLMSDEGIK